MLTDPPSCFCPLLVSRSGVHQDTGLQEEELHAFPHFVSQLSFSVSCFKAWLPISQLFLCPASYLANHSFSLLLNHCSLAKWLLFLSFLPVSRPIPWTLSSIAFIAFLKGLFSPLYGTTPCFGGPSISFPDLNHWLCECMCSLLLTSSSYNPRQIDP